MQGFWEISTLFGGRFSFLVALFLPSFDHMPGREFRLCEAFRKRERERIFCSVEFISFKSSNTISLVQWEEGGYEEFNACRRTQQVERRMCARDTWEGREKGEEKGFMGENEGGTRQVTHWKEFGSAECGNGGWLQMCLPRGMQLCCRSIIQVSFIEWGPGQHVVSCFGEVRNRLG